MNATAPDHEPGFLLTSFALFGGPVIWMVHLVANSALVPASCNHDLSWLLNLSTGVTAVIAALSVAASLLVLRHYRSAVGTYTGRTQLLAFLGAFFGVASVMLILLEGMPVLVIGECAR
ncbi:MAG: hypothetical protein JWL70_737 [Acidimicrobiia bacterium]|nr:hypothetical protein [Acidimicrobiia bacterium]